MVISRPKVPPNACEFGDGVNNGRVWACSDHLDGLIGLRSSGAGAGQFGRRASSARLLASRAFF
jgi:hypothetical protein